MNKPSAIALTIAVVAAVWMLSGIFAGGDAAPEEQAKEEQAKKVPKVRVEKVSPVMAPLSVSITGRSRAARSVEIRAEVPGRVTEILVEKGSAVEAGVELAKLNLKDRKSRVSEARQLVNQKQIEYNAAKELQEKGFNSRIRLSQSLAELEAARASLKLAQENFQNTDITAPFEGIVFEQMIEVGDYVDTGEQLYTIVDLNPIEFSGFVSEKQVQMIDLGDTAQIEFLDGRTATGTISFIAPAANETTRTFAIELTAPNEDMAIKEGLTADITITAGETQAHKISPSILALNDDGVVGVKVVDAQNKVVFKPISVLEDKPDYMLVTGLDGPATIITVGQEFVIEGQTVEPVMATGGK